MLTPIMEETQIRILYQKYIDGNLNDAEKKEWGNLLSRQDAEKTILSAMDVDYENIIADQVINLPDNRSEEILSVVLSQSAMRIRSLWPRIAIAASLAFFIITAGLFYFDQRYNSAGKYDEDVMPGKNGATLTLGNGKKMYISDLKAGKLAEESGVSITKDVNGVLIYTVVDDAGSGNQMNTLETSRGEQSQVRLPDGSIVYLNAASTLRYPSSFTRKAKRKVELSGEGYFEIAKDKQQPFVVVSGSQQVEVLGTHFNINAYKDESGINTTLLEGSVRVIQQGLNGTNPKSLVLKPAQQSYANHKVLEVNQVNTDEVIAWKNGYFQFNKASLPTLMRQLSRWYDIEVVYQGEIGEHEFVGEIKRDSKLSQVLQILEQGGLRFKIEGRRLTVMP